MNRHRPLGVVALGAVVLFGSEGCLSEILDAQPRAEATFERTLSVNGAVDLDVRTGSGDIQIVTGPGSSVHVIGHIRASRQNAEERVKQIMAAPPIQQNANAIRIGDTGNDPLYRNVTISYELTVPAETRLRARSGSGDQTISSIQGPIDVGTGSGTIRIAQTSSDVLASAGSGDIELERSGGSFVATTGSGSIRAAAVGGAVKVRTGSGRIEVTQTNPADVDAETGSGRIAIAGARSAVRARAGSGSITVAGQPGQSWDLEAGSGDITVELGADAAFNLDARTGSGSIETNHPLTVFGAISPHRIQGTVRGGGPRVGISTGSGSVGIH